MEWTDCVVNIMVLEAVVVDGHGKQRDGRMSLWTSWWTFRCAVTNTECGRIMMINCYQYHCKSVQSLTDADALQ